MASATTAGEGGSGTFWAKARAECRGVRATAELRARVVAGSTSESSLQENLVTHCEQDASLEVGQFLFTHVIALATTWEISSAALVTRRLTVLTTFSASDVAAGASFLTGDPVLAERDL
jgi:hypothetical protein